MAQYTREQLILIAKARARAKAKKSPVEQPKTDLASQATDIIKGIVTGVNEGVAALPGLPGTAQQLMQAGDEQLGFPLSKTFPVTAPLAWMPQLPTSGDTINAWENFAGKLPQPDTRAGKYAKRFGEFMSVPGGGPLRAITGAAGAAAGSRGAEEVFGDGSIPSILGALAGGKIAHSLPGMREASPTRIMAKDPLSDEEVLKSREGHYSDLKQERMLDPNHYARSMSGAIRELNQEGLLFVPSVKAAINEITKDLRRGQPIAFVDVEKIHRMAGRMARSVDGHERAAGRILDQHVSQFYNTARSSNPNFAEQVGVARDLGRSALIMDRVNEAERAGEFAKAGEVEGATGKLRSLVSSKKGSYLTPVEQEAFKRATSAGGYKLANAANSNLFRIMGGLASLGTGHLGPIALAMGSGLTGSAAKKFLLDPMTKGRINDLKMVVRGGRVRQARALDEAIRLNKRKSQNASSLLLSGTVQVDPAKYNRDREK